jgi:hypothetical protein
VSNVTTSLRTTLAVESVERRRALKEDCGEERTRDQINQVAHKLAAMYNNWPDHHLRADEQQTGGIRGSQT